MDKLLKRAVRLVHPKPERGNPAKISFDEALDTYPNVVLLGDPGAGKTKLFELGSASEGGALFHAKSFPIYADQTISGSCVYIDALDEKRSRGETEDSISGIVEKLVSHKPSRVRISCRALDWLGETDLVLFKPYFESNGGFAVVRLEQLSEGDQLSMLSVLGVSDPKSFLDVAIEKGLHSLLGNPQNLLMLKEAVGSDGNEQWPESRYDVFDKATKLLLVEHNSKRQSKLSHPSGVDDLTQAAGAACAAMLISDTRGITLHPSSAATGPPSFDQVPFPNHQLVSVALQSRVFEHIEEDVVATSHRTVAEFLGANWLSVQIRNGLPLNRVLSLITVDEYPALELRGLCAWLPNFLPHHAIQLIKNDPIAIILYGDPKSLSTELRRALVTSLVAHSAHDPWFYSRDFEQDALGKLSGQDMIEVFRQLLSAENDNYRLRTLILDAIRHGPQLPELLDDLIDILGSREATYAERQSAFRAAVNISPNGATRVAELTKREFLSCRDDSRLAANIIEELYLDHFNPEHIIRLVSTYLFGNGKRVLGELWFVCKRIPDGDHVEILNGLSNLISGDDKAHWETRSEVTYLFCGLLAEAIKLADESDIERIYQWLRSLYAFQIRDNFGAANTDQIKSWLQNRPEFVRKMFRIAFDRDDSERLWMFWHDFSGTVFNAFCLELFVPDLLEICSDVQAEEDKRKRAYSLLISHCYQSEPVNVDLFEKLYILASGEPLRELFEDTNFMPIDIVHHKQAVRSIADRKQQKERQENTKADFDKDASLIRDGYHLDWMRWTSGIYFGLTDTDNSGSRWHRLVAELGEHRAELAGLGMQKLIMHTDKLPSAVHILEMRKRSEYQQWWYAIIGGLDLSWSVNQSIDHLPDETIEAGLAVELYYPVWDHDGNSSQLSKHGWIDTAYSERLSLVLNTFEKCAKFDLESGKNSSDAIFRLTNEDALKEASSDLLFSLLCDYHNAAPNQVSQLLSYCLGRPELRQRLHSLSTGLLSKFEQIDEEQQNIWLGALFVIVNGELPSRLRERINNVNDTSIIWALRDAVTEYKDDEKSGISALSTIRLEFLTELFGTRFPIEDPPSEGWSGSQNNWDANEYVQYLINELSSRTDGASIEALKNLSELSEMSGYRNHLLHARANQATLYRQERFVQPAWNETVGALRNGPPANMSDLLHLTIDHLRTIEQQLRNNNIDALKVFWNEDSYGRITSPKSEESARDALVGHLRPVFEIQRMRVEPEGHMNQDKRADIVVLPPPSQKLPIELKRDYHKDAWSACETQLDRLYTRDPEADGYGVYLVFWYGDKRPSKVPKPPEHIDMPASAEEMELALTSLIPVSKRNQLKAVVLDLSQVV